MVIMDFRIRDYMLVQVHDLLKWEGNLFSWIPKLMCSVPIVIHGEVLQESYLLFYFFCICHGIYQNCVASFIFWTIIFLYDLLNVVRLCSDSWFVTSTAMFHIQATIPRI